MKSVLISIRPKWVKKITSGKKTIEVRKSAPKEVPFKAYIYCSYGNDRENYMLGKQGKIIGDFICDEVEEFHEWELSPQGKFAEFEEERLEKFLSATCLSIAEVFRYRDNLPYCKPLYGWHISDLKIYDKPKELSEFSKPCPVANRNCENCLSLGKPYTWDFDEKKGEIYCTRRVTRPPQSWQYVEELK